MVNTEKPPKPEWRLADIVDFEYFLSTESADGPAALENRLRTAIESLLASPGSPATHRRQVFRLWLEARRGKSDSRRLPGAALEGALRTVASVLTVLSFCAGAGLVLALLERATSSFNVQLFFAATVLLQLALLAILLIGWVFRRALSGAIPFSFAQCAIRAAALRLAGKIDRADRATGAIGAFMRSHGRMVSRMAFGISQFAGIAFNAGLLAAFFGCLLVLDLNFYWESTFGPGMDRALHKLTGIVALPWSWARPGWVPSLDAIQVRGAASGALGRVTATDPRVWYPFLLCSIFVWALLPRLLLRSLAGIAQRRALRNPSFDQRHHRELWRRLTAVDLRASAPEPADSAMVLNWNGIEVPPGELHDRVIRCLRLNPIETHTLGVSTAQADDEALHAISQRRRDSHRAQRDSTAAIVVLAESWGLAPKRMQEFHAKIRAHLGRELPLHFFLVGAPAADTRFTAPPPEDVRVWESFLPTLNDPDADIRPFRAL